MTRIPDAISVAGPDTHCLVVAVPYTGEAEISSNLPRPVAASVLRQLANGLEQQPCATALATGGPCPVHDAPTADGEEQQRATVPDRPALDLLTELYEELGHGRRAQHLAAALLDQHTRGLADAVAELGKARGWSIWAADYLHPDREFVDTGATTAEEPTTPAEGEQYVKREAPDKGRVVTVKHVWATDDGHLAVSYSWDEPRVSSAGSACPLDVFHRTYAPATEQPTDEQLAATARAYRAAAGEVDALPVPPDAQAAGPTAAAGARRMRDAAAHALRCMADEMHPATP